MEAAWRRCSISVSESNVSEARSRRSLSPGELSLVMRVVFCSFWSEVLSVFTSRSRDIHGDRKRRHHRKVVSVKVRENLRVTENPWTDSCMKQGREVMSGVTRQER